MDAREVLRKISVEETIDWSIATKDNEEGIGVRIRFVDGRKDEEIIDIDGLTRDSLHLVRFGILRLLNFIDTKIKEGPSHE